jgi:transcription initiation factor IIE alpha subunit
MGMIHFVMSNDLFCPAEASLCRGFSVIKGCLLQTFNQEKFVMDDDLMDKQKSPPVAPRCTIGNVEVSFNQEGQLSGAHFCPKCHSSLSIKDVKKGARCPDCGHTVTFDDLKKPWEVFEKMP